MEVLKSINPKKDVDVNRYPFNGLRNFVEAVRVEPGNIAMFDDNTVRFT